MAGRYFARISLACTARFRFFSNTAIVACVLTRTSSSSELSHISTTPLRCSRSTILLLSLSKAAISMCCILHFAIRASPFYGVLRNHTADDHHERILPLRAYAVAQRLSLFAGFLLRLSQDLIRLFPGFPPQCIRLLARKARLIRQKLAALLLRLEQKRLCLRARLLNRKVGLSFCLQDFIDRFGCHSITSCRL